VRRRKDGEAVDVSVAISPIRDIDGEIVGASKIARDISEQKRAQASQDLLLREMRHRINNLFLVINALVGLSAQSAKTPLEMAKAIQGRLSALNRAHELTRPGLIDPGGRPNQQASLKEIVSAIFEPYLDKDSANPDRVAFNGTDLEIGERNVTNVALVLHELATNSAKYGSLSKANGAVQLSSAVESGSLQLTWKEVGGPEVTGPSDQQGFGSVLTRQIIGNHFSGKLDQLWEKSGLVVKLEIPLSQLL
jgi:two-component sensor histidine kinase